MGSNLIYREIWSGEETKICELILDCFNEFVAPGYSQKGIEEFCKYVNPAALSNRLKNSESFVIMACYNEQVVGVMEVRSFNHISLLFVKKEHHKKGIAKMLLQHSIEKCKQFNPSLKEIDINSSPYAVDIYKKMGFIQTDNEQVINGIRFIHMVLKLSDFSMEISSICGGLELLPLVKPLWEALREHHGRISKDFSKSIRQRTFDERLADFESKASNHNFRIELIKVNPSQPPIGYCISSVSNELVGEVESIFIEETYRGRHIGDILMKNALNWMDEHGIKTKRINVAAGNDVLGFYEKYGFKVRSHILEQVDLG